jgi:hypothetical protein
MGRVARLSFVDVEGDSRQPLSTVCYLFSFYLTSSVLKYS